MRNKIHYLLLLACFIFCITHFLSQDVELPSEIKKDNKLNNIFSSESKIDIINSKANLSRPIVSEKIIQNQKISIKSSDFVDSIRNQLLVNKEVRLEYKNADILSKIKFNDFQDTIDLADINVFSPVGGVPLVYTYEVKKGDKIFYEIRNFSSKKLKSIEVKEGDFSRFVKQNLNKKDFIKSSFVVTSDNTLTIEIKNDDFIKNLGLLKSSIRIVIKKLTNISLNSEIIYDTIFTKKKVMETKFDTIIKIEANKKINLASKQNIINNNKYTFPLIVNTKDSLIAYSYWIGLNKNDSLQIDDVRSNPLSNFSLNELNNQKTETKDMELLFSENKDLSFRFENYTLDRRSLNLSDNYSVFRVDNPYTMSLVKKGLVKIENNSTLYDYDIQFVSFSISLVPSRFEVEKDVGEIKKYIKMTLSGF
tara:strand:- start:5759 stop:7021 length:1263 start_codon:yes stop_codon:yes gene_type:complete